MFQYNTRQRYRPLGIGNASVPCSTSKLTTSTLMYGQKLLEEKRWGADLLSPALPHCSTCVTELDTQPHALGQRKLISPAKY